MLRWLVTVISAGSLLLCVASTIEAVRGISRRDQLTCQTRLGTAQFTSNWGWFAVWVGRGVEQPEQIWFSDEAWKEMPWESAGPGSGIMSTHFDHLGIGYNAGWYISQQPDGSTGRARFRLLAFPSWVMPWLTALLPAWWFIRRRRVRRRLRRIASGNCGGCGYSLSGNTSGTCPECGTPVPRKAEASA